MDRSQKPGIFQTTPTTKWKTSKMVPQITGLQLHTPTHCRENRYKSGYPLQKITMAEETPEEEVTMLKREHFETREVELI